eukprot:gene10787-biopygen19829
MGTRFRGTLTAGKGTPTTGKGAPTAELPPGRVPRPPGRTPDGREGCPDGRERCPDRRDPVRREGYPDRREGCPDGRKVCPDRRKMCPGRQKVCPGRQKVCPGRNLYFYSKYCQGCFSPVTGARHPPRRGRSPTCFRQSPFMSARINQNGRLVDQPGPPRESAASPAPTSRDGQWPTARWIWSGPSYKPDATNHCKELQGRADNHVHRVAGVCVKGVYSGRPTTPREPGGHPGVRRRRPGHKGCQGAGNAQPQHRGAAPACRARQPNAKIRRGAASGPATARPAPPRRWSCCSAAARATGRPTRDCARLRVPPRQLGSQGSTTSRATHPPSEGNRSTPMTCGDITWERACARRARACVRTTPDCAPQTDAARAWLPRGPVPFDDPPTTLEPTGPTRWRGGEETPPPCARVGPSVGPVAGGSSKDTGPEAAAAPSATATAAPTAMAAVAGQGVPHGLRRGSVEITLHGAETLSGAEITLPAPGLHFPAPRSHFPATLSGAGITFP